ncbi:hypothetical protein NEIFL0001_1132 [Neisseria flavescens SK114]|nr:hypothetical protein NEIFL0001_1132 [Neisseria flavescens SK114]
MRLLIERFNIAIRPSENWLSDGLMLIYPKYAITPLSF